MSLREAAEMALEALEESWEEHEAIDALRQALAESANSTTNFVEPKTPVQPEQYDQTALELCEKCGWKAIIPDEGCLVCAREKHEPVAWMEIKDIAGFKEISVWQEPVSDKAIPLYTAPPKREWVGLVEQDVHDAFQFTELIKQLSWERERPEWCENFAAYIEARLKEKNT
jgi:hypothetical protein